MKIDAASAIGVFAGYYPRMNIEFIAGISVSIFIRYAGQVIWQVGVLVVVEALTAVLVGDGDEIPG